MTDVMNWADDEFAFKYPTWATRVSSRTDTGYYGAETQSIPPSLKSDIVTNLKPVRVSITAGGQQLDYADFVWHISAPLINRGYQPASFTKMVDVVFPTEITGYDDPDEGWIDTTLPNRRAFIGDYNDELESVDATESLTGRAEVRQYMYGKAFAGMVVRGNDVDGVEMTGTDAVFNPMIDGAVHGNKFSIPNFWADPEFGKTANSVTVNGTPSLWTLIDVVKAMCHWCNSEEKFIKNPVLNADSPIWTESPEIRDLQLATGQYLPQYLDQILHPLGYNWFLEHDNGFEVFDATDLEFQKPQIVVFRKGVAGYDNTTSLDGTSANLKFQAPGSTLDLSESNVNEYEIHRRIGDAVTGVRIFGDKLRAEVTLPLYPCWKAEKDALTGADLSIKEGAEYAANKHVHRLWCANEGNDYFELRADPDPYPIGDAPDLDEIFKMDVPGSDFIHTACLRRRRTLDDPLTFQGGNLNERVRRKVLAEYRESPDSSWVEISSKVGSWDLLGDQIGIMFVDDEPPADIMAAFASGDMEMRITGTIASDHYLHNVVEDTDSEYKDYYVTGGVQGRLNMLTMRMPDRYRHWFVVGGEDPDDRNLEDHPFKSALLDDPAGADVYDDRAALATYAAQIIKPMLHAEIDGTFLIPGFSLEYRIGMLIEEIEGRSIMLSAATSESGNAFMQITGIQWELNDEDGPQTRLIVDRGVREYVDPGYTPPRQPNRASTLPAQVRQLSQGLPDMSAVQQSIDYLSANHFGGVPGYTNPLMQ